MHPLQTFGLVAHSISGMTYLPFPYMERFKHQSKIWLLEYDTDIVKFCDKHNDYENGFTWNNIGICIGPKNGMKYAFF